MKQKFEFEFEHFEQMESLSETDASLLIAARNATKQHLHLIPNSKWALLPCYPMVKLLLGPIKKVPVIQWVFVQKELY